MADESVPARPATPASPVGPAPGSFAQLLSEQFSFEKSIGGWRGALESVLPMTVFSVVYAFGQNLRLSVIAALAPAVVMAVWRLVAREPLTQAVSGLLGIGLGAVIAVRTGRAQDIAIPSMIKNAAYAAAYAVSAVVRWPLIGVVLGFALGENTHWRQVPARMRAYSRATWVWVGLFGFRLAVQVPLYLAGAAATLALVNVGLGLPPFALAIWLTWVLVRRVPVAHPPATQSPREPEPLDEPAAPRQP
jgi:intracellular septation protein A